MKDKDFFPHHAEKFIKCLGIYPVGSLVRLNSGETAVVMGANPERPLLPTVKIVLNSAMRSRAPENVDLAQPGSCSGNGRQGVLRIEAILDHKALKIDPSAYMVS